MSALNFPSNPSLQSPVNVYGPTSTPDSTSNGVTYKWDGSRWKTVGSGVSLAPNDIAYTYPGGVQQDLQNRLEQSYSVIDFGAVGDGVNDDTAAIQACFDYAKAQFSVNTYLHDFTDPYTDETTSTRGMHRTQCVKVLFPPGKQYRITDTINLTDWRWNHSVWYVEARGAIFMLEMAGKPAFDLLKSRKCSWYGGNFTSVGDPIAAKETLVKSVFQMGRDEKGQAADTHRFTAIDIKGYYSWAPMYNFCSEDCYFDGVNLKNDWDNANSYCFIQDSHNIWGVTSEFVPSPKKYDLGSFLRNTFIRCDFRKNYAGGTVWMGTGAVYHQFIASYLVGTCPSANPRTRLVTFYAAPSLITPTNIRTEINNHLFDVHVESDEGDTDPATGLDVCFYMSGELTVLYKATGGEATITSGLGNYPIFTLYAGSEEITKISDANPSGELLTLGVDYTVNNYTSAGIPASITLTTPLQGPDQTTTPPKVVGDVIAIGNQAETVSNAGDIVSNIKEATLSNFSFHDRNTHSQKYIFERNTNVFDLVEIRACDLKFNIGRDTGQVMFDNPAKFTMSGNVVNLSDPVERVIPLDFTVVSGTSTLTSGANGVPEFYLASGEEVVTVNNERQSPEVDYSFNGSYTRITLVDGISSSDTIKINVNGVVLPSSVYYLSPQESTDGKVIVINPGEIVAGDNVVLRINGIRLAEVPDYVLSEFNAGGGAIRSTLTFANALSAGDVVKGNTNGGFTLGGAIFRGDYYCRDAISGQSTNSDSSYRLITGDGSAHKGDSTYISKPNSRASLRFFEESTFGDFTDVPDLSIEANTGNKRITFKYEDNLGNSQSNYVFTDSALYPANTGTNADLGTLSNPWPTVYVESISIKDTGSGSTPGVLTVVNGQLRFNGSVIS